MHPAQKRTVRDWDSKFPIGTEVIYAGRTYRTWSHAGIGKRGQPSVFLDGIQEPIPIAAIHVPGYVSISGAAARKEMNATHLALDS